MIRLFVLLVALSGLAAPATLFATHFRQGEIRWRVPDPTNAPLTVEFEVRVAWRSSFIDTVTLNFGDGGSIAFPPGTSAGGGTDTAGNPYSVIEYTTTHTYASASMFTAYFSSCCRMSGLVNAADDFFRVESRVDLSSGNAFPPLTVAAPMIPMQVGGIRSMILPTLDGDGVPVTCRFATATEMGDSTTVNPPMIPGGQFPTLSVTASPPGCLLAWNTGPAVAGQSYAVQVVVESTNPGSGAQSRTVSDFIIEMVNTPVPTCTGPSLAYVYVGGDAATDYVMTSSNGNPALTARFGGMPGTLAPNAGQAGTSPMAIRHEWLATSADYGRIRAGWVGAQDSQSKLGYCGTFLIALPNNEFADGFEN